MIHPSRDLAVAVCNRCIAGSRCGGGDCISVIKSSFTLPFNLCLNALSNAMSTSVAACAFPHSTPQDPCPASLTSSSSSDSQAFQHLRSQHEACLRCLYGSPLPAGHVEEGNTCDGYGVKLFEDGCLYAGDFEAGQRSGFGVQRWPTGHVYIGLWKYDKREGEGEYRLSYGDTDGSGVIEDSECDVYQATLHQFFTNRKVVIRCCRASG